MDNPLEVVGAREASAILNVELQRISRWRKTGKLPPPYADLALSPVWVRADIERLAEDGTLSSFAHPPDPPQLMGTAEVAAFLGVDKSRVARWRNSDRVKFPLPDTAIVAGPLWARSSIEAFAKARNTSLMLTTGQVEKLLGAGATDGLEPVGKTKAGELFDPQQVHALTA